MSAVAVWRAALCADWHRHLSAGEQAVVMLLGADRKQAGILRRYCEGFLRMPMLAQELVRRTDEVIEFRNGASLEIATNDARLVRGRSAIAVLGSECAYWKTDENAASSDEEVVAAAEPSMSMCPDGGMVLLGSSVNRKKGYMYRKYKELHGNNDSDDICWFAPSRAMNPKLAQHFIDKALAEDESKAGAEYLNRFREIPATLFRSISWRASATSASTNGRRSGPSITSLTATQQAAPAPTRSRSRSRIAGTIRMIPFGWTQCGSASRK